MEVSRRESVGAAPAVVWAFAIDVERWPAVMDHIDRIDRCDQGQFGLGSSATLTQPGLPTTIWTVDRFISGESFRWRGRPLGMAMTADHIIRPSREGLTDLTLLVTASGWMAVLLGPVVRKAVERALVKEFSGFRMACE